MEWIFWIEINRRSWFKKLWSTRGANFIDIQIFGYLLSIGLPWKKCVIDGYKRDYTNKAESHIKQVNQQNLKHKFSIKIPGKFK